MPERIPQSTTIRVPLQAYLASDHISPATGKTIAVTISKNGAAYGNPSGGATNATEIASGSYYVDLSTTDTGTVGPLFVKGTEGTIDTVILIFNVVKATNAGFTALPDTACTTNASLITSGTSTAQLSVSSGQVTVATNNDKTGYSLTQAFPSNFSSLAITVGGAVTVGTNNDKTGYSLSQSFPTNFSSLAITGGGAVTAGTVSDKTGYSLSQSFPSNFASLAISGAGLVSANTTQLAGSSTAATNLANAYANFETGTAQAGGSSSITLRSGASSNNDYYTNQAVFIISGTGAGQTNKITTYVGSTKVATVETAWVVQPDNTSVYFVLGRIG